MPVDKTQKKNGAAEVAGKHGFSLISDEKFRQIHSQMLRHAKAHRSIAKNITADLTALAVGVLMHLQPEDTVVLTRRHIASALIKGMPADELARVRKTRNGGLQDASSNVIFTAGVSPATQTGFAIGVALSNKMAKDHKLTVVFLEGGAAAVHASQEALEIASEYQLPIVFVVDVCAEEADELNGLSELFPVINVDAHDVVAVYRVAQESTQRVREGTGPAMIVCLPCEGEKAKADSVASFEQYLTRKGLFNQRLKDKALAGAERELERLSS
ncbi:thiamine pyrophosphate-dependent enzyme [Silvibacterium acidisoli]|uniref:thiamine pyrophosphate-dependent enzyme n=1 Tax=Acidobacteriaceae bacterium ZG23-2 TaxID=2883246 RepID=UPI00406C9001